MHRATATAPCSSQCPAYAPSCPTAPRYLSPNSSTRFTLQRSNGSDTWGASEFSLDGRHRWRSTRSLWKAAHYVACGPSLLRQVVTHCHTS
eukprot:2090568-Amphidinium_carterae.1